MSGMQPLRTTSRRRCSAPILNIGDADEWQAVEEKWNIRLALRGLSRRRLNEVFHRFGSEDGLGCADEFAEIICAPTTSDQRPDVRYGLGATRQRPEIQSGLPHRQHACLECAVAAARAGFRYSQNGTLCNFGATVARLIRP